MPDAALPPLMALLRACRGPDRVRAESAFTELYRVLQPPVASRVARFGGRLDAFTLDALVDEAILRAVLGRRGPDGRLRARFEPTSSTGDAALLGYAVRTAQRLAVDALRAQGESVDVDPDTLPAAPGEDAVGPVRDRLDTLRTEWLERLRGLHHRHEQQVLFAWSALREGRSSIPWTRFTRDNPVHFPRTWHGPLPPAEVGRLAALLTSRFDLTVDVLPLQGPIELPDEATGRAHALVAAVHAAGAPPVKDPSRRPGRPAAEPRVDASRPTLRVLPPRVHRVAGLRLLPRDGATSESPASARQHFHNSGGRLLLALHLLRHHLDAELRRTWRPTAGSRVAAALRDLAARRHARFRLTPLDLVLLDALLDALPSRLEPDWTALATHLRDPDVPSAHATPGLASWLVADPHVRLVAHGPAHVHDALCAALRDQLDHAEVRHPDRALARLLHSPGPGPLRLAWQRAPATDAAALQARARSHLTGLLLTTAVTLRRHDTSPSRPVEAR